MLLATVAAVAILSSAALGQTLPQGVQKGPSMGGITEYDFPNGLTVLLYPDPANPKVTVDVTYTVGSRHEGYGETGMAHLLEHMNFIETTNGRKIKDEIVSHGAQWNGAPPAMTALTSSKLSQPAMRILSGPSAWKPTAW